MLVSIQVSAILPPWLGRIPETILPSSTGGTSIVHFFGGKVLKKILIAIATTSILVGANLSPVVADITDGGSVEEQANQTQYGSDTAKITQTEDTAAGSDPVSQAADRLSQDLGTMTNDPAMQMDALLQDPNSLQTTVGGSSSGGMCFNGCCVRPGCVVSNVGMGLALNCAAAGSLPDAAACVKEADSDKFYSALSCTYDKNPGSGACAGMISTLPGDNNLYACSQPTGTSIANVGWPQIGTNANF